MKRFLITNPKFAGAAEVIYNPNGLLILIDLTNVTMAEDQLSYFKSKVPANMLTQNIADAFSKDTVVIMADVEITFNMFWAKYSKKINRLRSEGLWKKLPQHEQVEAFIGIAAYDKFLKKEVWRNKADPDTYLRNKYYQNEYK